MKVVGITGGVGAGKSSVLKYIKKACNCVIVTADDIGNEVKEPGEECYDRLVDLLGKGILDKDGHIDKKKMASVIFNDEALLKSSNDIIHPAVIDRIKHKCDEERKRGKVDYFFIEAALLIECGFNDYVDQMWYIHADEEVRRERLKASRGYDDEKIDSIMASQLDEKAFRAGSDAVIDNSKGFEETKKQIDSILSGV